METDIPAVNYVIDISDLVHTVTVSLLEPDEFRIWYTVHAILNYLVSGQDIVFNPELEDIVPSIVAEFEWIVQEAVDRILDTDTVYLDIDLSVNEANILAFPRTWSKEVPYNKPVYNPNTHPDYPLLNECDPFL